MQLNRPKISNGKSQNPNTKGRYYLFNAAIVYHYTLLYTDNRLSVNHVLQATNDHFQY